VSLLEVVLPLVCAIVSALAAAVAMLYRDLSKQHAGALARVVKLEAELDAERAARIGTAEKNTQWALELQEKQHAMIDKLTGIADVLQRRRS